MGQAPTRIRATIEFDEDGVRTGYLRLPHSVNESAYGWIPIPVVSIRNGAGPRVLLVAGSHGDEYEGQVALTKLAKDLDPATINGQVLILPAANFPAAVAGTRVSPIDHGNLNRSFPGDPNGSPTEMMADYIEYTLLPQMDYVVDLHAGGYSLTYLPCALARRSDDPVTMKAQLDMLHAFGAPLGYIPDGGQGGAARTLAAASQRQGVHAITAELGGAASLSVDGLRLAEEGVKRVLELVGVIAAEQGSGSSSTRLMEVNGRSYFVYATEAGVFEPRCALGDEVERGQVAGLIHDPTTPWEAPVSVRFDTSGTIICARAPARTARGDCLFQLATPLQHEA